MGRTHVGACRWTHALEASVTRYGKGAMAHVQGRGRINQRPPQCEHRPIRGSDESRPRDNNPMLLINDDGLIDPGGQRHPSRASYIRFSKDDLLDWLNRLHQQARSVPTKLSARGGRPPLVDWTLVKAEAFRLMDHHDEFSADDPEWNAQVRLEEAIQKFCVSKFGVEPATSTLRGHLGQALKDWRGRKSET